MHSFSPFQVGSRELHSSHLQSSKAEQWFYHSKSSTPVGTSVFVSVLISRRCVPLWMSRKSREGRHGTPTPLRGLHTADLQSLTAGQPFIPGAVPKVSLLFSPWYKQPSCCPTARLIVRSDIAALHDTGALLGNTANPVGFPS